MWASLKEGPSLHWEVGVVEMALLLPKSESLLCEGRVSTPSFLLAGGLSALGTVLSLQR